MHNFKNTAEQAQLGPNAFASMLLLACALWPMNSQAIEKRTCTEHWFEASLSDAIDQRRSPDRVRECPAPKRGTPLDEAGFRIVDNRAYWYSTTRERSSPCAGKGVGALGQILDPACHLPYSLQIHRTNEVRTFWLASTDGANFRKVALPPASLTQAQQYQAGRYAVDSGAVYLGSRRLAGADPSTFTLHFPDTTHPKVLDHSFGQDNEHVFIDGWQIPMITLSHARWEDVLCTGDASRCRDTEYRAAVVGRVGYDILFLLPTMPPTFLPGLATPDLACSRDGFDHYCVSGGKRYRLEAVIDGPARLMPLAD